LAPAIDREAPRWFSESRLGPRRLECSPLPIALVLHLDIFQMSKLFLAQPEVRASAVALTERLQDSAQIVLAQPQPDPDLKARVGQLREQAGGLTTMLQSGSAGGPRRPAA
jgi:hypothetical protein